ncbi:MAG: hypothetical protein RLZZ21_263 [Planctomycetota bacterium]|jgi:hypothetical protein
MKALMWIVGGVIVAVMGVAVWNASDPKLKIERQQELHRKAAAKQAEQQAYADSWKAWADDAKKKTDAKAAESADPSWRQGFDVGYTAGHMLARGGAERPTSAKLEAMSRKAARAADIDGAANTPFTTGYTAGFSYGWQSGK